ncbi:haloacid dehalogenase-like hydrolase [Tautonia rosea]|uniref:haloacid dehalogenase-like hydrolase n=1 Tax=Tautonia rosea TaxID=2728037 RepID=UPI0014732D98|nr:haloacid dehalogenase-like hydrolase [Tautonia rosea]
MSEVAIPGDDGQGKPCVLFVDLDGSLVTTDLLFEHVFVLIKQKPWCAPLLLWWLRLGRAGLKDEVARRVTIDPTTLPYNDAVLTQIQQLRDDGTLLVLATAAPRAWADAVANHLGLFEAVLATEPGRNLKGLGKLNAIRAFCRDRGLVHLDYLGDAAPDIVIWSNARRAYVVSPSRQLVRRLQKHLPPSVEVCLLGPSRRPLLAAINALEPAGWLKNLLVFLPWVLSGRWNDPSAAGSVILAFLAMGLATSSVGILQSLMELATDRLHPIRRQRSFASGQLPLTWGPPMIVGLMSASLLLAATTLPVTTLAAVIGFGSLAMMAAILIRESSSLGMLITLLLDFLRLQVGASALHTEPTAAMIIIVTALSLTLSGLRRASPPSQATPHHSRPAS